MTENPFEPESKVRKWQFKKSTNKNSNLDIEPKLMEHQPVENKYIDGCLRILYFLNEHQWSVIVLVALFVPEFGSWIIIITLFSKQIINYIKDHYLK